MKTSFLAMAFFVLFQLSAFSQRNKNENKIQDAMNTQQKAWNNADIDGYMGYYWNSDSLKFIGKSGVSYGWEITLQHYKKSYPGKESMGVLTFADIKMYKLKWNLIMVTGSWKLERKRDALSGYYSLLWRKIKGKWLIIVDHTS
jgi:ketosteroid isomerase-like protein